jgi:hypothetical protein
MSTRRIGSFKASRALILSSAVSLAGAISAARAQSGQQAIILRDDGQVQPTVAYFATPDFAELRQPDFMKRDLPIFKDRLVLSDEQRAAVERQIEAYLAEFEKLMLEMLPKAPPGVTLDLGGGGMDGGHGAAAGDPHQAGEGEGEWTFDFAALEDMEGELPEGMGIGVDVRIGMPGPDGEQPEGDAPPSSVEVRIEPAEGQEVPEEVRKKLADEAAKIAEEVTRKIQERHAQGDAAGEPHALLVPGVGPGFSLEDMKAYHEEMEEKADDFRSAKASLRQSFVNEVQGTILAEPQIERWPSLERALLRSKSLPKGRLSGERTDLVKLLGSMELTDGERAAIAEQSEFYELALDHALRQRDAYVTDAHDEISKAMQEKDPDKALSIVDRAAALRIAVRSVNAQFAELIASLMPKAAGDEFRSLVLRNAYPRVYGKTYGQKCFEAVQKIEGVESKTLSAIGDLEKAYALELESMNTQVRQAIDKHQPLEPRQPIEHLKSVMEQRGGAPEVGGAMFATHQDADPIREAFDRRRSLDDRYVKLIREMLAPEQAEQLPKAPSRKRMEPVVIEVPKAAD